MEKHLTKPIKAGRPKGSKRFEEASTKAFGCVIRQTRQEKGVSQEALAEIASVDRSYMGRIERGETTPSLTLIFKLAEALDVSAGDLLVETKRLLDLENKS